MAAPTDRIVTNACGRLLLAAEYLDKGKREALAAMRALDQHPDVRRTKRLRKAGVSIRKALTLPYWLREGIVSTLYDGDVINAAEELRQDVNGGAAISMREAIEDEERVLADRAARREVKLRKAA